MASNNGPTATEAHQLLANSVPHAAVQGTPADLAAAAAAAAVAATAAAAAAEPTRPKSLKRMRETTPSSPDTSSTDDLSPAKIARLIGATRDSQTPTASLPLQDDGRRRIRGDQRQEDKPSLEVEPGDAETMNREQDAQSGAMATAVDEAAAAAARALGVVQIPGDAASDDQDVSPQSAVSLESGGGSMEDGEGHVVHSPGQMDVDGRDDQRLFSQQPVAQMDDGNRAAPSLSYPGLQAGNLMPAPAAPQPQRGMSLPTSSSQNTELAPSPSSKKHKCPYCETEFTRHHNLKSHLLTHSQEKPYVCQDCNLRFRRLHDLKRHSKLHTGEKPHVCPKCQRSFARGDALARHSKGAGGCAGRRSSIGGFVGDEDFESANLSELDESAMSGVVFDGNADANMTDEERRRSSMPSIKAQQASDQPGQEATFAQHSNTYPPTGARPAGGLYPPNVGPASTATSPSVPNSHTPHTSVSSMPLSAGSSSMYSQSGMTESPKPLSPGVAQANQTGQKRASVQPLHPGLTLAQHGISPAGKQAWLSQYPPADGTSPEGNAAGGHSGRGRGRSSGGTQRQVSNGTAVTENAPFTDSGVWVYAQHIEEQLKQHLDEQLKQVVADGEASRKQLTDQIRAHENLISALSAEVGAASKREAQLVERLNTQEQLVAALTAELAALRQQLTGPQEVAQVPE